MKIKLLFCCFIFLVQIVLAQQQNKLIEDLEKDLNSVSEDTLKITYLYRLGEAYKSVDLEKSMQYADQGLKKAEQINWKRGVAALHLLKGNIYADKGKIELALKHLNIALETNQKRKDNNAISATLNNIGGVYLNIDDYPKAISYYNQSLKLAKNHQDLDMMGLAQMNIGQVFYAQEDFTKAMGYFQKSLESFQKSGNGIKITASYKSIGLAFHALNDKEKAIQYFQKALAAYKENNDLDGIATIYSYLGEANDDNISIALNYRLQAQEIWEELNPTKVEAIYNLGNIGNDYFQLAKADTTQKLSAEHRNQYLDLALNYTSRSIRHAQLSQMSDAQSHYLINLSEIQQFQGKYEEALANLKKGQKLKDSIYSQENKNKIAKIESQRDLERKDQQIQINQLALKNAKNTKWALIGGITFLLTIAGLLFYQNRTRKKNNQKLKVLNTELEKANQIKTKFFGILSHDLRNPIAKLIGFLNLQKEFPGAIENPKEHQEKISISAENLLNNMETLLLWSKSQMEHFEPQIKEVSVHHLFEVLKTQIQIQDDIQFSFSNPNALKIYTDENYVLTIMQNLNTNAIKALGHTPNPKIEWSAKEENHKIILAIKDNGPGIEHSQFKALTDENSVIKIANGLGFHIIRDLSKIINCHIEVNSIQNQGTIFKLSFSSD